MLLTAYRLSFPITAVNTVAKTFTVVGDKRTTISNGSTPSVEGSTGNDGAYTISSTSFDGTNTVVTINEAIPSAVADGSLALVLGKDTSEWDRSDLGGDEPFMAESTVGIGRVDISDSINWDKYGISAGLDDREIRNILVGDAVANWVTYTDSHKKACIRNYVYPSTVTSGELDALYTSAERTSFRDAVMEKLRSVEHQIVRSSIPGSAKYFDVRLDDDGFQTLQEIEPHTKIENSAATKPPNTISGQTTDATPLALYTFPIADDIACILEVSIVGRASDGVSGTYILVARVSRTSGGPAVLGINSPDTRHVDEGDLDWNATISVNGNDAIVQVVGEAALTINWTAAVTVREAA